MKKTLLILLVLCSIFSFAACGSNKQEEPAQTASITTEQFTETVRTFVQVGSLYQPISYEKFNAEYGIPLAVLPSLPERFTNDGNVYIWDLEKTADGVTGRVMQLWYDADAQEEICVNQANLPTRNDHSESSYTKLQQTSVDGLISWPVYQYTYKCRLGSETDTNVYWYGVNNIGEDSCGSMLNDVKINETQK